MSREEAVGVCEELSRKYPDTSHWKLDKRASLICFVGAGNKRKLIRIDSGISINFVDSLTNPDLYPEPQSSVINSQKIIYFINDIEKQKLGSRDRFSVDDIAFMLARKLFGPVKIISFQQIASRLGEGTLSKFINTSGVWRRNVGDMETIYESLEKFGEDWLRSENLYYILDVAIGRKLKEYTVIHDFELFMSNQSLKDIRNCSDANLSEIAIHEEKTVESVNEILDRGEFYNSFPRSRLLLSIYLTSRIFGVDSIKIR